MSVKKSFFIFVNLFMFLLIILNLFQSYSVYRLFDKRIMSVKQEQIDHVFDMYRPRLIGNILLNDKQLVDDLLKIMGSGQNYNITLEGVVNAEFNGNNSISTSLVRRFPLNFGQENLGVLTIQASVPFLLQDLLKECLPLITIQIILSVAICILLLVFLKRRIIIPLEKLNLMIEKDDPDLKQIAETLPEELKKTAIAHFSAQNSLKKLTEYQAVARTTQALAHDVRKPFSMFRMIIDAVEGESDPTEAKQLLKESLPEVQQAMASVNGMISDILEIGSESAPITESTNPETLIESTLNEIFRVYPDSDVSVTFKLNHKHKVNVDTLKIGRVFSNIMGNAVQAMNQKGELWFKTDELEEHGKPFIKFCLGNGGTFIPPENLAKLFEAFFTSGKKGGTGLGLAIAQKIVTAHGGKIWCESDAQRGVEFFFTLPRSNELIDRRPQPLPASSADITATFERLRKSAQTGARFETDPLEVTLEKEIIKLVKAAGAPLKVLIVDDEGVYRNSLAALINRSEDFKGHIALSFAKTSHEALEALQASPALIVQDVDLGANSLNGHEVLKTLRAQGYRGVVCIHSNRTSPDDYKVAVEAGADAILPKPMSRSHFLKLMLQAAERSKEHAQSVTILEPTFPEFALLDDSKLILRAWQRKMAKDALVHIFTSPAEFRTHATVHDGFLERLRFVVTDFYFAEGVFETGFTFAEGLRRQFKKPIILCSDGDFTPEMIAGHVDAVISKEPVCWEELVKAIDSAK